MKRKDIGIELGDSNPKKVEIPFKELKKEIVPTSFKLIPTFNIFFTGYYAQDSNSPGISTLIQRLGTGKYQDFTSKCHIDGIDLQFVTKATKLGPVKLQYSRGSSRGWLKSVAQALSPHISKAEILIYCIRAIDFASIEYSDFGFSQYPRHPLLVAITQCDLVSDSKLTLISKKAKKLALMRPTKVFSYVLCSAKTGLGCDLLETALLSHWENRIQSRTHKNMQKQFNDRYIVQRFIGLHAEDRNKKIYFNFCSSMYISIKRKKIRDFTQIKTHADQGNRTLGALVLLEREIVILTSLGNPLFWLLISPSLIDLIAQLFSILPSQAYDVISGYLEDSDISILLRELKKTDTDKKEYSQQIEFCKNQIKQLPTSAKELAINLSKDIFHSIYHTESKVAPNHAVIPRLSVRDQ